MRRAARLWCAFALIACWCGDVLATRAIERTRRGQVRLEGRALTDDGGAFNALGATLFWALWGEKHDPDRLDANLAWLAERGVDYVRILAMVGGESWSDRVIDPRDTGYWATVDRLFERLARHRLRAHVTIFAGAQDVMPDPPERRRFADAWASRAKADPERVLMLEVANEAYQNGLGDVAEVRSLGAALAARTDTLIALSAPAHGQACATYAGSSADLATVHYDRSTSESLWSPVWQPWTWPRGFDAACRGQLPVAVNNEPIGPQSSVNEDDDPDRLVMAYVTTFVGQNAAYVVHTGAGIRGGGSGDLVRSRSANLWEVPNLAKTLEGMQRARSYLPHGLANWERLEPGSAEHPLQSADETYAARSGNRFVVTILRRPGAAPLRARRAIEVDVHAPRGGEPVARLKVSSGEILNVPGDGAFVLTGTW